MKKILPHIIYLLVIVFFVVFGNIKANEAEKNFIMAKSAQEKAQEIAEIAAQREQDANQAAAQARMEATRADHLAMQLHECKNGK